MSSVAPNLADSAPSRPYAIIEAEGLCKHYGSRAAVSALSLQVRAGTMMAVLGPNGSGKSTLLKLMATLLRPDSGRLIIGGFDAIGDADAARRALGVVFQSSSVDGKLSVRENLRCHGLLHGLGGSALRASVERVLKDFDLLPRAGDLVERLSGGLRRRVELAKALLHHPQLVLLDEPSSGLDPAARLEFWELLHRLQEQRGTTIIVATHLMDEAERCGQVLLLDGGQSLAMDTPQRLKEALGRRVLTIQTEQPRELAARIATRFAVTCHVGARQLQLEEKKGEPMPTVEQLFGEYEASLQTIQLGRPTLEDVYLHLTGHRFQHPAGELS